MATRRARSRNVIDFCDSDLDFTTHEQKKQEVNKHTWKMAVLEQKEKRKHVDILREFRASFFSMNRLASFPWTFIETELQNKSSEFTSELLKQTCLHPLCETFPPSVRFRRLFLTELIKRQEAAGCDPLDELYDALAEVVGVEETPDCYKSYFLPNGDAISLLESIALISEGTTGLVTWEAALYLAEWTLENQQVFTGRSVLELGSGVGLTGITVCRSCNPLRFVFSDCHSAVLEKLRENVRLNRLGEETSPAIRVDELDWTTVTEEQIRGIRADTVIAADVVYDPDVAGSLVKLLLKILDCSSAEAQPEIYICSTVRNPETYGDFKLQLEAAGLNHEVMTGPVGAVFPYNRLAPLELMKVFR
ncbi:protein-lysine N-methyltransferase EEF2KMT-like [Girardinichthys multiradiatus]|uniref:protein-lysine N-methyltransferase EEF2KMT-like n=1 Tax=Girardinichthys multiradiatus TaxID=208333 RepID=UPI001FAB38E3|nr:protein-lysine N-methyltransferase EEF2KMT-like [Girardinichthys multiradiatus]XP_047214805.1 protein-lysine N-methyltransferase EEF2KMT-like [Girardinichthys multiradiatus]